MFNLNCFSIIGSYFDTIWKGLGELGKVDDAIIRLKVALGNIPDSAAFFHRLGWLYQKKRDFHEADKYYKKSCELNEHLF